MGLRHDQAKLVLITEHGGCCKKCGYKRSQGALVFHHTDPANKDFGIGSRLSANLTVLRVEAAKCLLLCMNCHQEYHDGLWDMKDLHPR